MSKPDSKKILILKQGDVPTRWVDEAKKRIESHLDTALVDDDTSPDVVILFTSERNISNTLMQYPHAVLLLIAPQQPNGVKERIIGYLPFTVNSAIEIIQALIDMKAIPNPKPVWDHPTIVGLRIS